MNLSNLTPETMSKNERSILLYAETCLVDHGGCLEGVRMNAQDLADLKTLSERGILTFGRIPAKLLKNSLNRQATHWVRFTEAGWTLAHACRRLRAQQLGPYARDIDEYLKENAS